MHRVDTSTAVAVMPAPAAQGSPGFFSAGNPSTGTPATIPGEAWFNSIQEEICNAIEDAGITLDKSDNTQLRTLLRQIGMPAGIVTSVFAPAPPAGWLALEGTLHSRTTYADLYAYAISVGNIVDDATWLAEHGAGGCGKFSHGDGATTFRIPDMRAEFLRGWDNGRGVDAGRLLSTWQAGELEEHDHNYTASNFSGSVSRGSGSDSISHGTRATTLTGGPETRPRNVSALYIIKY